MDSLQRLYGIAFPNDKLLKDRGTSSLSPCSGKFQAWLRSTRSFRKKLQSVIIGTVAACSMPVQRGVYVAIVAIDNCFRSTCEDNFSAHT